MKKLIVQLFKFGIVGVIAALVDFGVLVLLKEVFHVDVLWASGISFAVSVVANYVLSMLFVFKGGKVGKVAEFVIFVALSLGGLGINQAIMWLGTDWLQLHYLLVKLTALFVVPVYNFVTRKIFLEKKA